MVDKTLKVKLIYYKNNQKSSILDLMNSLFSEERLKELNFLKSEKEKNPDLFRTNLFADDNDTLKFIGINNVFDEERPKVYLKLWPQDFIVEEVLKDGSVQTVDLGPKIPEQSKIKREDQTVYATLVKVGKSTLDAIEDISKKTNIDRNSISYGGIKDKDALTSQLLSFRKVDIDSLIELELPDLFLKNIYTGKGVIDKGMIYGNRFIILLRFLDKIDETYFKESIFNLEEFGFYNFFYLQRFGRPRLLSHLLGLYLLRGEYEKIISTFLTESSKRELPYFTKLRGRLKSWGRNWKAIKEEIKNFPSILWLENKLIDYLADNPDDFIGALKQVPEQIQLWVYAYASYLFNRVLSEYVTSGKDIPDGLPLVLSPNPADREIYEKFLKSDGLNSFNGLRPFPFIQLRKRIIPVQFTAKIKGAVLKDWGVVLNFTLPKGAYATTFLSHIFTLVSGAPLPKNVYLEPVDSKEILGVGKVAPVKERFKNVIIRKGLELEELLE